MSSFFWSASGSNRSLAWSMDTGGRGYSVLRFPLKLDWYKAQPCQKFRTLRHHKERGGVFQHEFIVLQLIDDSVCRVERMGDPAARINALSVDGSMAFDVIECFRSSDEAGLDTSDVVAEVTFPYELDVLDVLHVCRAIHEGSKTCNYTLSTFNCYFFALAIQSTLTRGIAMWGGTKGEITQNDWVSEIKKVKSSLSHLHNLPLNSQPFILRICRLLALDTTWPTEHSVAKLTKPTLGLMILSSINDRIKSHLWRMDVETAIEKLCHQFMRDLTVDILCKSHNELIGESTVLSATRLVKELVLQAASQHKVLESRDSVFSERLQYYTKSFQTFTLLGVREEPSSQRESRPSESLILNFQPQHAPHDVQLAAPIQRLNRSYVISPAQVRYWLHIFIEAVFFLAWITWGLDLRQLIMSVLSLFSPRTQGTTIEHLLSPLLLQAEASSNCLEMLTRALWSIARSGTATWNEWPWAHASTAISNAALKLALAYEEKCLILKLQGSSSTQSVTVSFFQQHLRRRVKLHAERIDLFGVGVAERLCDDIQHRLSQVWALVRNDETIELSWRTIDGSRVVIRSSTPVREIIAHLAARGCSNLTDHIDASSYSTVAHAQGGFGDVYKAMLRDGTWVAVKTLRVHPHSDDSMTDSPKRAAHELYTWSRCSHRNVLPLLGLVEFRGQIGMVSRWMVNGSLPAYLATHPESDRCALSSELCDGVAYIHSAGVIHGSLKGVNVLVSDHGVPMITDFGDAVIQNGSLQFSPITGGVQITPAWAAPELLKQDRMIQSKEADVYALGMTILEVMTGKSPYWECHSVLQAIIQITSGQTPPRPDQHIPPTSRQGNTLWALLVHSWAQDPNARPSAQEVADKMREIQREGLMALPRP